jgi:hypothetical protein
LAEGGRTNQAIQAAAAANFTKGTVAGWSMSQDSGDQGMLNQDG